MDIEGAELQAFKGASSLLQQQRMSLEQQQGSNVLAIASPLSG